MGDLGAVSVTIRSASIVSGATPPTSGTELSVVKGLAQRTREQRQTGVMSEDCVFCRVIAGDAPAYVVAEDDRTMAFLDRGQATTGHTLVAPRAHASDIWGISEADAVAVMAMAKRVAT